MQPTSTPDFRPLPLLGNRHVQTLLATFFFGPAPRPGSRPRLLGLPDGDQLVLHDSIPSRWQPGDPVVVLLHGLSGSHRTSYIRRMAAHLLGYGVRAVRPDLRGAGHGFPFARRPYHAGCSDDIRAVLAEVHRWAPESPVVVAGISLGGNIALKLAGEVRDHPVPNLVGVAAIGPPIDLHRCLNLLTLPANRFYETHFLQHLVMVARRRWRHFRESEPLRFPQQMTLRLFDELYTAPRSGFTGASDYYQRASAGPFIPRIEVPAFVLTARDDPFIAVEPFEGLEKLDNVKVQIVERGGHIGFLGWDGAGGVYWAERRVVDWIVRLLKLRKR